MNSSYVSTWDREADVTKKDDYGRHYLVDLVNCDPATLRLVGPTREVFLRAAQESNATIMGEKFHQFEPEGVSGVLLIAESHFSVHTWPEDGFAAVDIFTCGDEMDPEAAIAVLASAFGAEQTVVKVLRRGRLDEVELNGD
jgi:S-adenosylmethionine decarboxylase proenzyme